MRVKNEGVRSEEVGRRISVRRREEEEEGNKGDGGGGGGEEGKNVNRKKLENKSAEIGSMIGGSGSKINILRSEQDS